MHPFYIILNFILLITIRFGKGSNSQSSSKSGTKSGSKSGSKSSSSDNNSNGNNGNNNDQDLCSCFDIDLMCDPVLRGQQICYYYKLNRASTASYCSNNINYFAMGTGDINECGLKSTDIDNIVIDYAPKCYSIDTEFDGQSINGIKFGLQGSKCGGSSSSHSKSKSSSNSKSGGDRRRVLRRLGGGGNSDSKSDTKSDTKSGTKPSSDSSDSSEEIDPATSDDFLIFSICFDVSSVAGTQTNGQIEIGQDNNIYTCDVQHILPDFCGNV